MQTEQDLLERYGAFAFERQLHFASLIGSYSWNVDMKKGEISFANGMNFPMQILGTFSHSSETWLWGWANERSGIPEALLQQANTLKQYGETNAIDLLQVDTFDATKNDLHCIGLIACGMFAASGYYLADYGQGILVLTVNSEEIDQQRKDDKITMLSSFPQFLSQFEVHHRTALVHFLNARGYTVTENGNELSAKKNEDTLIALFDEDGRMTNLKG